MNDNFYYKNLRILLFFGEKKEEEDVLRKVVVYTTWSNEILYTKKTLKQLE